mmetsp:Transcript_19385/g.65893  ORF Transcript_19385/g.65893 Transcript_19385/m.65893 type:complete len:84 (+) Transcript_19385:3469-3720(+)
MAVAVCVSDFYTVDCHMILQKEAYFQYDIYQLEVLLCRQVSNQSVPGLSDLGGEFQLQDSISNHTILVQLSQTSAVPEKHLKR